MPWPRKRLSNPSSSKRCQCGRRPTRLPKFIAFCRFHDLSTPAELICSENPWCPSPVIHAGPSCSSRAMFLLFTVSSHSPAVVEGSGGGPTSVSSIFIHFALPRRLLRQFHFPNCTPYSFNSTDVLCICLCNAALWRATSIVIAKIFLLLPLQKNNFCLLRGSYMYIYISPH